MRKQPNILIFIPHDLGDHLHCYGYESVVSPNLDKLSEQGVKFTNYFTTAPECTASRGSMMTGLQSHQNGLLGLSNFDWEIYDHVPHLAQRMKNNSYQTHLFGFQHETHKSPESLGYQHLHSQENMKVSAVCDSFIEFIDKRENDNDSPWFAYTGFFDVHRDGSRAWSYGSSFDPEEIDVPDYLPDNPIIRNDFALFYENILVMDREIGRILKKLEETGMDKDTLVIFTTDHGLPFPRAKATFYDPGIKIPLIMHWPGVIDGGKNYPQLLSNVDFSPTILEAAGFDTPDNIEGRSFWPLLNGQEYTERSAVFGSLFFDVSYDPMHYVRTTKHKYIRSFAVTQEDADGVDPDVLASFEGGQWIRVDDFDVMSSPAWHSMKTEQPKPPREELYDLENDPLEQNNLVNDPASEEILKEMRQILNKMMQETESPLLKGHASPSPGQKTAGLNYRPGGKQYEKYCR